MAKQTSTLPQYQYKKKHGFFYNLKKYRILTLMCVPAIVFFFAFNYMPLPGIYVAKNIQGALEELYDLCDPDYMVDMLVNYSEEFDDISPALLAKSFQKNAEMISEYRVLSSAGEGIDYQGKVLLNSRAVRLLSYVEDMSGDEKVRTIQSKELWLAEDMTFYVVSCMSTITMDKEEAICLNEHRSVVTTVECEDDIFFDMGSLICELDDICLFELLADVDATIYEL